MTLPRLPFDHRRASARRWFGLRAVTVALAFALTVSAASDQVPFNLPKDSAEKSLKRFSEQAGKEVLFASAITRGIRTNPVKGEMRPGEAIDFLLANTGLVAVHDLKTGAYSVRKKTPEEAKNGQRAAQTVSDRPVNLPQSLPANLPKTLQKL